MMTSGQIKFLKSLHLSKFREKNGLFIVEGEKMVLELIKSRYETVKIYGTENWFFSVKDQKNEVLKISHKISEKELGRISSMKTPNKVFAVAKMKHFDLSPDLLHDELVLMLDEIKDPGNLGTIFRIADWFGIKKIICSQGTVELYNPKVVQASMGSLFSLDIFYDDLKEILISLNGKMPVYGTFLAGDNIYSEKLSKSGIIIFGNETNGISKEIEKYVDKKLFIPSYGSSAESLNASVATAIVCSEFRRRKY